MAEVRSILPDGHAEMQLPFEALAPMLLSHFTDISVQVGIASPRDVSQSERVRFASTEALGRSLAHVNMFLVMFRSTGDVEGECSPKMSRLASSAACSLFVARRSQSKDAACRAYGDQTPELSCG